MADSPDGRVKFIEPLLVLAIFRSAEMSEKVQLPVGQLKRIRAVSGEKTLTLIADCIPGATVFISLTCHEVSIEDQQHPTILEKRHRTLQDPRRSNLTEPSQLQL